MQAKDYKARKASYARELEDGIALLRAGYNEKLKILELLRWTDLSAEHAAGEVKQATEEAGATVGRSELWDACLELLADHNLPDEFDKTHVFHALTEHYSEIAEKSNLGSVARMLRKAAEDGDIKQVGGGAGRAAARYRFYEEEKP